MKKLLPLLAAAGFALSFAAHAADAPAAGASATAKAPTAQQTRMKTCNADAGAKNLKGDERKAFMKECLSGNKASTQQDKMKSCNADAGAKNLKGDARKAFMKECLSGPAS